MADPISVAAAFIMGVVVGGAFMFLFMDGFSQ